MKKKNYIILIFACLLSSKVFSQSFQLLVSPKPSPYFSDWSNRTETARIIVNNTSGASFDCKIKTQLFNSSGNVVGETNFSKMPIITIAPGISQFNAEDIYPVSALIYNGGSQNSIAQTGRIPDDNYRLCSNLMDPVTGIALNGLQPQCAVFTIAAYQAPVLIAPREEEIIPLNNIRGMIFRWSPVTPTPNYIATYKLQVWEVLEGQDNVTAIRTNQPIVDKDYKGLTQTQWPVDFTLPEEGKKYVWTITALDDQDRKMVDGIGIAEPKGFSVKKSTIIPNAKISLVSPRQGEVASGDITFIWLPGGQPVPIDGYTLRIVEVLNEQSDMDAINKNPVIFEKKEIMTTSCNYPNNESKMKKGKKYAWIILEKTNRSEVKTFTFNSTKKSTKSLSDGCINFENSSISPIGNWNNSYCSSSIVLDSTNKDNNTNTLVINDNSGASGVINNTDFSGNWSNKNCICFDYKANWNESIGTNYNWPQFFIYTGAPATNVMDVYGGRFYARFVGNIGGPQLEFDTWANWCVASGQCINGLPPSNSYGHWVVYDGSQTNPNTYANYPLTGTQACTVFNNLIQNVTGLVLPCDYNSQPSEVIQFDNFCSNNCPPNTTTSTPSICDSLSAVAVPTNASNCCYKVNITMPQNTSSIKKIQFIPLSPISFVNPSKGSGYGSGYIGAQSSTGYKITKFGGVFPSGQLNDFFNFCLNPMTSPQYMVVNYLGTDVSGNDSIICNDTITLNCVIPCVTILNDSIICDGSNYKLKYSFQNNSNFSISKLYYTVISPTGATLSVGSNTLSPIVASGQNSSIINLGLSNILQNTEICILIRFQGPDSCCWCYDTICVTTPSCICDKVDASITGDPNSCCYNLSLINNYAANYFTQINLTGLTTGSTIHTFNFNGNWGSLSVFPDTMVQIANSNGIPILNNFTNIGNLCFNNFQSSPQQILIEWIHDGIVVCTDTLTTPCIGKPAINDCAQIINDEITCLPDGTFKYTFQIQNNSSNTSTGFQLNPISPSGVSLTPYDFPTVSLLPHAVSSIQTLIISGVGNNTNLCFETAIYKHENNYSWCCHGDTVCITTPNCPSGCLDIIGIDSITCNYQNPTGGYNYSGSITISNPTGTSIPSNTITSTCGNIANLPTNIPTGTHTYNITFNTASTNCCIKYTKNQCKDSICFALPLCPPPPGCLDLKTFTNITCNYQNAAGGFNYSGSLTITNPGSPIPSSTITSNCGTIINLPPTIPTGTNTYNNISFNTMSSNCCIKYNNNPCKDSICFALPSCIPPCLDLKTFTNITCNYQNAAGGYNYSGSLTITNPGSPVPSSTITSNCGAIINLPSTIPTGTNTFNNISFNTMSSNCCIKYNNNPCKDSICFALPLCIPPCLDIVKLNFLECKGKNSAGGYDYSFSISLSNPTSIPISKVWISTSCGTINGLPNMIPPGLSNFTGTFSTFNQSVTNCCIKYTNKGCKDSLCFDLPPCTPPCLEIQKVFKLTCNGKNSAGGFNYSGYITVSNPGIPVSSATISSNCGAIIGLPPTIPTGTHTYTISFTSEKSNCCIRYINNLCENKLCFDLPPCSESKCLEFPKEVKISCKGKNEKGGYDYSLYVTINNPNTFPVSSATISTTCGNIIGLPNNIPPGVHNYSVILSTENYEIKKCCINTCKEPICFELPPCSESKCIDIKGIKTIKCKSLNFSGGYDYEFSISVNNPNTFAISSADFFTSCGSIIGNPVMIPPGTSLFTGKFSTSSKNLKDCCIYYKNENCSVEICFKLPACSVIGPR